MVGKAEYHICPYYVRELGGLDFVCALKGEYVSDVCITKGFLLRKGDSLLCSGSVVIPASDLEELLDVEKDFLSVHADNECGCFYKVYKNRST